MSVQQPPAGEGFEELVGVLRDLTGALHGTEAEHGHVIIPASQVDEMRAQARYQALVEQIPALTFTVSLEEGTPEIYVGPQIEEILGFTQEEWMEDPILWFAQCHPEDRDIWHQEFARGIATGGPFVAECRVFAKDKSIVWLHGEARLVRDDAGQPLFLQGIAFDITESKKAEQKMKEAQEIRVLNERLSAVGQMAASIGHDLRNPLGAIRNSWHYISKRLPDSDVVENDPRVEKLGAVIERELAHCTAIISELLEFARDREPYKVACPLGELVEEALSVVNVPNESILISNSVDADLPVPHLDRDQMRQVVVNLLQNAVEAVGKHGRVEARGRFEDHTQRVVLDVIDDGAGILPELHEQIWKPLFTTKVKGTGLGLPIVANIVQRHDGEVFVESAPGSGATFSLYLQIGEPSEGPAPQR